MVTLDFAAGCGGSWSFAPCCPSCRSYDLTIRCQTTVSLETKSAGALPSVIADEWDYAADETQLVTCSKCKTEFTLAQALKAGKSGQLKVGRKHAVQAGHRRR